MPVRRRYTIFFVAIAFLGLFWGQDVFAAKTCSCQLLISGAPTASGEIDNFPGSLRIRAVNVGKSFDFRFENSTINLKPSSFFTPEVFQAAVGNDVYPVTSYNNGDDPSDYAYELTGGTSITGEECANAASIFSSGDRDGSDLIRDPSGLNQNDTFYVIHVGQCTVSGEYDSQPQVPTQPTAPVSEAEPVFSSSTIQQIRGLNQLPGVGSIDQFIGRVLGVVIGVLGTIAIIIFIYGGVLWMISAGNTERSGKALKTILWAGVGILAILGSSALIRYFFDIF